MPDRDGGAYRGGGAVMRSRTVSLFLVSGGPFVRQSADAPNDTPGIRAEGERSAGLPQSGLPQTEPRAILAPVVAAVPALPDCRTLARGGFGQLGDTLHAPGCPPLPASA